MLCCERKLLTWSELGRQQHERMIELPIMALIGTSYCWMKGVIEKESNGGSISFEWLAMIM